MYNTKRGHFLVVESQTDVVFLFVFFFSLCVSVPTAWSGIDGGVKADVGSVSFSMQRRNNTGRKSNCQPFFNLCGCMFFYICFYW